MLINTNVDNIFFIRHIIRLEEEKRSFVIDSRVFLPIVIFQSSSDNAVNRTRKSLFDFEVNATHWLKTTGLLYL